LIAMAIIGNNRKSEFHKKPREMKIEHLAIWTNDLEAVRAFYMKYFGMNSKAIYRNPSKQFTSYFLFFEGQETRLELMHRQDVADFIGQKGITNGLCHFSISVGSKQKVNALTEQLRKDGFTIAGEARCTGDGYYESVVLDCEGNRVEITE
jgi:lactoylglutathione lyase